MKTPYQRGAEAERELRRLLYEKLSIEAWRVTAPQGVDLVLLGIPVEVKKRQEVPETMQYAFVNLVADSVYVGGPPELYFGDLNPLKIPILMSPGWVKHLPPHGILAVRLPRAGFALFSKWDVFLKVRRILEIGP